MVDELQNVSDDKILEYVTDKARSVFTRRAAEIWMDRPNPNLGGEKPSILVKIGEAGSVLDYIEALRQGESERSIH